MEYLALLYGDENAGPEPGTPEFDAMMAGYGAFDEVASPVMRGGLALQPISEAGAKTARVPADGAEPVVVDGPFAEMTEVIGGYYVFEVENLDEVIALAKQIPAADEGTIELRPLAVFNGEDRTDGSGARFIALIYGQEGTPGTPEWDVMAKQHQAFGEKNATAIAEGAALQPTATATCLKNRDGDTIVTDGPFAETTEVMGGYYILRAPSLDAAADIARQIPTTPGGAIEVRPIMEFD